MKEIVLVHISLSIANVTFGQRFMRNMEFEVDPSVVFHAKANGAKVEPTWNLFAEVRYNLTELPVDVGIQLGFGAFDRDWDHINGVSKTYHFRNLLVVGDYNLRRGKNVSPYVGCGLGIQVKSKTPFY